MALTKQQARDVITGGGSVLHKGKLFTKPEHLKNFDGTEEEKQSEIETLRQRLAELETVETEEKPAEEKKQTQKQEKTPKSAKDEK